MPRNPSDVYAPPANTDAVSNDPISSTKFNSIVTDITADLNLARPVVAGGTGATSASAARTNLGLGTIATQAADGVDIDGGAMDGTTVGATTPSTGAFTTLSATGNVSIQKANPLLIVNATDTATWPQVQLQRNGVTVSRLYRNETTKRTILEAFDDDGNNGRTYQLLDETQNFNAIAAATLRWGDAVASFTRMEQIGPISIVAAGAVSAAHTLGAGAQVVAIELECTTDELGYSAGQRVLASPTFHVSGINFTNSFVADASNVTGRFSTGFGGTSSFAIPNATTGVSGGINNANWDLYVTVIA